MSDAFYVSTPIYYANGEPHIGHFYTNLIADALARSMRLNGSDVFFSTGTDEHGQKIKHSADELNISTEEFVERNSNAFRNMNTLMNCSNNTFIRTTNEQHKKAVIALWNRLWENNCIYLSEYSGWYSIREEAFYDESEIIDGLSPFGSPVEWTKEESYFFNLSKWQEPLLNLYKDKDFIFPQSRSNEVINFVKSGLRDLSVSRINSQWGIPVPNNPKHTIYVWVDALTNYLSALNYPDTNSTLYQKYWANGKTVHVIGKDILRFHAVYWPALLMAAELPLPKKLIVNGWWTSNGQKISKSLGNAVDYSNLIEMFGLDAVRYFFLREISLGNDGDFDQKIMINRINADLSNNIGNLVQRSLSMVHNYCDGYIPKYSLTHLDNELLQQFYNAIQHQVITGNTLSLIQTLADRANKFIDKEAPWTLKVNDVDRMHSVLFITLEIIRCIGIYLMPYIPDSSKRLLSYIGINEVKNFKELNNTLQSGVKLPTFSPLFPRILSQG